MVRGQSKPFDIPAAIRDIERICYPESLSTGLPELDEGVEDLNIFIVEGDKIPVGYCLVEAAGEEAYVSDLAILPEWRSKALRPLLRDMHTFCKKRGLQCLSADLRESTSYKVLSRLGPAYGFKIFECGEPEERDGGEIFYPVRILVV